MNQHPLLFISDFVASLEKPTSTCISLYGLHGLRKTDPSP